MDLITGMRAELDFLRAKPVALKVRVADLEAQLRTNSQNSSQPPSADGPGKTATGRCGHRSSASTATPAQTLKQVPDPDVVIRHEPTCGHGCGSDLSSAAELNCSRQQVFDIPSIKVHVTERQIISRRCHCGKTSTGDAPTQATAAVQYGPVMCAVII